MPIEYQTGDLFTTSAQALAHGCNCKGVMGAGIALAFRRRYTGMFNGYRSMCLNGNFQPGDYFAYSAPDGKIILNLATQVYPGACAKVEWIESALTKVLEDLPNLKTIALPQIGAGLGGLDWEDVKDMLERLANKTETLFIVYKYSM